MSELRKGTNSAVMKDRNIRLILNMARIGRYSRADIAKMTGLTKATVTILTEELINNGYIFETPDDDYSGVGRRPLKLSLCTSCAYTLGISLDRRKYQIGLYDISGKAVLCHDFNYSESTDKSIHEMSEKLNEYIGENSDKNIVGIGVASPGPVDYKNGKILNPPNFEIWHGYEIVKVLEEIFGLPVFLENISNALAINQKYFGKCRDEDNYAYLLVDDGVGAGIVVDGKIYRGKNGYGNEIGHTSIAYDGIMCACGNKGCLECYASSSAILKGTKYASWQEAVGDREIVEREAEYLSVALTNMLNLFDLEKIVLGGEIAYKGDELASIIKKTLSQRVITHNTLPVILDESASPKSLAAAAIAFHNLIF